MNYEKIEKIYLKLLRVNNLLNNNLATIARDNNFNSTELMIYLDIKTHPGTDLNALCRRLGLKKSAASKALSKLILNNQIKSSVNAFDQRKVSLTHIETKEESLCQESVLTKTFSGLNRNDCDLNRIDESLTDVISLLSSEKE